MEVEKRADILSDEEAYAADVLQERARLLPGITRAFNQATREIMGQFGLAIAASQTLPVSGELPRKATRKIYAELLTTPGLAEIWSGIPLDLNLPPTILQQIFGLGFNKYKEIEGGQPTMRTRFCSTTNQEIPYPVHTHFDVPFFMQRFGIGRSVLSLALSANHDAFEEGTYFFYIVRGGKVFQLKVDPQRFISGFLDNYLGRQLAIGVPLLTESSFNEMSEAIEKNALEQFYKIVVDAYNGLVETSFFGRDEKQTIAKTLIDDPLVFGGLAFQINLAVKKLYQLAQSNSGKQLTPDQLRDLATSIIEVEIGDRMSDMADFPRFWKLYPYSPTLVRYRTIAHAARMLNVFEKLSEAIPFTSSNQWFEKAMAGYLHILRIKIEEMNSRLREEHQDPITFEETSRYFNDIFKPIQAKAEEIMEPFIARKVDEILQLA